MGGFGDVLGHVAQGFEGARQVELQRQFEAEQNRRTQIGGFLQKIAGDEAAHPYSRQQAINEYIKLGQTPWNKPYKFDPNVLVAPPEQQQAASFTPPPQPPVSLGSTNIPAPTGTATLAPEAGVFMSPEQHTAMMAQRTGAVTGAQAGAEAKFPVMQVDPATGQMRQTFASGTGQPIGQPVENAFNPMLLRGMMGMLHPVNAVGPDGIPIPAIQNKMTGEVYDQNGQLIPNAQVFSPALVPKVSTESMNAAGQITRKHTAVPSPRKPGGSSAPTQPALTQPMSALPAPPESIGGVPLPEVPKDTATSGAAQVKSPQPSKGPARPAGAPGPASAAGKAKGAGPQKPQYGSPEWQAQANPVQLAGWRWAIQGQKPVGGPMAERQVLAQMQKDGVSPSVPVNPGLQLKVQEQFVARNSAIGLIDDITRNSKVLSSLIGAGKIAIASNPDGSGVIQRLADLTDQEAKVAGDFAQLIEHANLLRGPLGATGFRGKEAWGALQAQRGRPLGDPRITAQVLSGMRDRLVGLNSADKLVLSGQGMSTAPATGGRKVKRANVDKAARDHGIDPAVAEQQAKDQGFEIIE